MLFVERAHHQQSITRMHMVWISKRQITLILISSGLLMKNAAQAEWNVSVDSTTCKAAGSWYPWASRKSANGKLHGLELIGSTGHDTLQTRA